MSGLVKAVKKVFKKVTNFVKKYWKVIVIAAAVYFTAGVALSYFGSTAGFASNMWGFGTNGVFSKAAVWMGFNGSASVASGISMSTGGAWAGAANAAFGTTLSASELAAAQAVGSTAQAGSAVTVSGGAGPTAAKEAGINAVMPGKISTTATQTITNAPTALSATDAAAKAMASAMKMQVASTILKTAAGFFQPSEEELMEKQHELQWGNAFGVGRDGDTTHGWASSGGSDAFRNMGMPAAAQYGDPNANQTPDPRSQYASKGGQDFLTSPFAAAQQPQQPQQMPQQDFIAAGG